MAQYEYCIVLALTLAGPLALSAGRKIPSYAHPMRLIAAIGLPLPLFVMWDVAATQRGHWNFIPIISHT